MYSHRYSINSSFTVNSSLFLHQCGREECRPGHSFGPEIRDHYLLHLVYRGKGRLIINQHSFEISEGQGFAIYPGEFSTYIADEEDPWYYGWMGFNGPDSSRVLSLCDISENQRIFRFAPLESAESCIIDLISEYGKTGNSFTAVSKMFELFSYLNPGKAISVSKGKAVDQAIDFIEKKYAEGITIEDIAKHINLTRSQLFRIFKEAINSSPQQFLLHCRLDLAATLLRTTSMSVEDIITTTGYNNASNFSRQFKQAYGYPPLVYRKRCKQNTARWDGECSLIITDEDQT